MFNDNIVNVTTIHKHLGMMFDSKLSFDEVSVKKKKKISKTLGLLRKFKYPPHNIRNNDLKIICQTSS